MKNFKSVDHILDFAIKNEEESYQFYKNLAAEQKDPAIQQMFTRFATEELGHKKKLENAKVNNSPIFPMEKIQTLNIAEYLVDMEPFDAMSYQDALVLAMKKEKKAFLLYTNLAEIAEDMNIQNLFYLLAQEEAKHKLRFEIEYDNDVLIEN